ncbi:hypothetical protein GCM10009854_31360 [Saccharopolyspora halophila]|uniref:Uncharacterized protein n=1 Tax=Saccharopolyspora halophila TaxID=405551 RepID=A0ABN3GGS5_9PSEU
MASSGMDLTDVRATMLRTLHLRALDANSPAPVLGDRYAAEAVRRIDYDWGRLAKRGLANDCYAVALRANRFDDLAAGFLRRHADAAVIDLGCGLDSRAFRLAPGSGVRWFDIDLPEVVELRRRLYADGDGYRMLAGSATDPRWLRELPSDGPTLVIIEGLLMYLSPAANRELFRRLTEHRTTGEIVFDGVAPWVAAKSRVLKRCFPRWHRAPAYLTSQRDYPGIIAETPGLRQITDVGVLTDTHRAPDPSVRRYYGLLGKVAAIENWMRVFRTAF